MQLHFHKTELLLKETFSIAYGNYDKRNALLVKLSYQNCDGFGECVEINYYGIQLPDFVEKLKKIQPKIEKHPIVHPKEFFAFLLKEQLHSFLLSALDCAYWDLYGKLEKKTFQELNGFSIKNLPKSSYTISVAEIKDQIKKMENSNWEIFKVKCNGLDKENIFSLLDAKKTIALDSNTSFTDEDCQFLQNEKRAQDFLYIEQPRPVGEFAVLQKNLFANWMADEDCQNSSYLTTLKPHYSAINIKLMKCGGITPALELISEAKKMNYKVMIGCMTESSVGISADIAVSSLCDFADLDGANLISNDFAKGSFVENGTLKVSESNGLGIYMV